MTKMNTKRTTRALPAERESNVRLPARLLTDIRGLIEETRKNVARSVNSALVMLYWHVGCRIRRAILKSKRAAYGEQILPTLSAKLRAEFGRGRSERNLAYMIRFAEAFPDKNKLHALCANFGWSHFRQLVHMDEPLKRDFYAEMCRLDQGNIRVAAYMTDLPPRKLLETRLHEAVQLARHRLPDARPEM